MTKKIFRDIFGNQINEGDTLIYPARKGADMWLNQARVVEIRRKTDLTPQVARNERGFYETTGWKNVTTYSIIAERNGTVQDGQMSSVEPRLVTLTRSDHLMVLGED